MQLINTPVTSHRFNGFSFFLKRDDLLHPHFSGNKARKLMSLLSYNNNDITHLVSHGSVQANSLLSFAALAKMKNWHCEFYVQRIPGWLKHHPTGNYKMALSLGAKVISMNEIGLPNCHPSDYVQQYKSNAHTLVVPEGGASPIAEPGIYQLAQEIIQWIHTEKIEQPLTLALPSGTGTTAIYLNKHLSGHDIEVVTCACVGGNAYLKQQFERLDKGEHPHILCLGKKHHFGKLYQEDYQIWQQLQKETQIEFDLLYDPYMWRCLVPWMKKNKRQLLYLHQGGLIGNQSLLPRYQRKFPLIT